MRSAPRRRTTPAASTVSSGDSERPRYSRAPACSATRDSRCPSTSCISRARCARSCSRARSSRSCWSRSSRAARSRSDCTRARRCPIATPIATSRAVTTTAAISTCHSGVVSSLGYSPSPNIDEVTKSALPIAMSSGRRLVTRETSARTAAPTARVETVLPAMTSTPTSSGARCRKGTTASAATPTTRSTTSAAPSRASLHCPVSSVDQTAPNAMRPASAATTSRQDCAHTRRPRGTGWSTVVVMSPSLGTPVPAPDRPKVGEAGPGGVTPRRRGPAPAGATAASPVR